MDKRFLGVLAAIIAIFIGIAVFAGGSKNNSPSNSNAQPTSHIKGDGSTGVTLVEYGDYECSVCEAYEPVVEQIISANFAKIHFQFRNLPLYPTPHPFALTAARAAEAANLQNKFWEMHDMLYQSSNWQQWTTSKDPVPLFNNYAQQIGLNVDQFKQDFASSKVNDVVQADLSEFDKTKQAKATPSFFLDGRFVELLSLTDDNGPSVTKFQAVIDAEIAAKTGANSNQNQ